MNKVKPAATTGETDRSVNARASLLFLDSYHLLAVRNDRLFARLFIFEWIGGIFLALWFAPRTYAGSQSVTHIHVYAAIFLGLIAVSLPLVLIRCAPGAALTRHTIAIAQMILTALLIDLTGGRIETHFLIFGTLAFLAFYKDWKVLVTASAVTAADHLLRGAILPQSIYGAEVVNSWRWLEHSGYVIFEDIFLIAACRYGMRERRIASTRQAELEGVESELRLIQDGLERTVASRTAELSTSNGALTEEIAQRRRDELALQYADPDPA